MKSSLDYKAPLLDRCASAPTIPRSDDKAFRMLRLINHHARLSLDRYPGATKHELRNGHNGLNEEAQIIWSMAQVQSASVCSSSRIASNVSTIRVALRLY
jgi:hypothetical protein